MLHTTDTTEALVSATHVPRTVGKPNRRALNTGLLTAIGRATIQPDRIESLLAILDSKHAGTRLSEAGH
jgi:hypothetical protein